MTGQAALAAHSSIAPFVGGSRGRMLNSILRIVCKRRIGKLDINDASVALVRARMEAIATRAGTHDARAVMSDLSVAGIECERLSPHGALNDLPVLLYLHGGAFIAGSARTHRAITATLACELGAQVILPDYRLAPEHRYPAAHDDAFAVYRALLDQVGAHRLAVVGDSAGGNLVLGTLLRARAAGVPMPAAAAVLSPWSDLSGSGESVVSNAVVDAMLPADKLEAAARLYAPHSDLLDPLLSPVFADFRGFPPLLIHAGTTEILYDDATRVLCAARAAGVQAHLRLWQHLPHVFHVFAQHLPVARIALTEVAQFIQGALAAAQHARPAASATQET